MELAFSNLSESHAGGPTYPDLPFQSGPILADPAGELGGGHADQLSHLRVTRTPIQPLPTSKTTPTITVRVSEHAVCLTYLWWPKPT